MDDFIENALDGIFFFGYYIISLIFVLILYFFSVFAYPSILFPSINDLPKIEPLFSKESIKGNSFSAISNSKINKPPSDSSSSNSSSLGEKFCSFASWFPLLSNWPIFYLLLFFCAPLAVAASVYDSTNREVADILFFPKFSLKISSSADVNKEEEEDNISTALFVAANISVWVGVYFTSMISFSYFMKAFNGVANALANKTLPISYYRSIEFQMTCFALGFYTAGVVLAILALAQEADFKFKTEYLPVQVQWISIACALFTLSLIKFIAFQGVYVILNLFFLEFITKWNFFWTVAHFCSYAGAFYFLSLANKDAGLILAGCFGFFAVLPNSLNTLVSLDFNIITPVKQIYKTWEIDLNNNGNLAFLETRDIDIILHDKKSLGYIGQKVNLVIINQFPWCWTMQDFVIGQHDISKSYQNAVRWNLYNSKFGFEPGVLLTRLFATPCMSFLRFPYAVLSCWLWCPVYFLKNCLSSCVRYPAEVFSKKENKKKPFKVWVSQPSGFPLRDLYENTPANNVRPFKKVCFFVDDSGLDSAIAHLEHFSSGGNRNRNRTGSKEVNEKYNKISMIFHCSSFAAVAKSMYAVWKNAPDTFWHRENRKGGGEFYMQWVIENYKISTRKEDFSDYVDALVAYIVELILTDEDLDLCRMKQSIKTKFSSCFHRHGPSFTEKSSDIFLSSKNNAFVTIGSSKLAYSVRSFKSSVKRIKPNSRITLYEVIYEDDIASLPHTY